ncbi:MAG: restriction endonuclease subunit S [Prevotellaceae bacterium]|jgi:hypothetical protein|nr:restriction endonuclease subunit S [Prevotellaceae bacterium]
MRVDELFTLHQGNGFELINMEVNADVRINFVSRTSNNNGVVASVEQYGNIQPFKSGLISVSLGGSVLSAFVQLNPFYTAFHVMVLESKRPMSLTEKLFYCMCIKNNAYRYSYGRQANKTLCTIELPDTIPGWVKEIPVNPIQTSNASCALPLSHLKWKEFSIHDLFDVKYGINMELDNCEIADKNDSEAVNFVARTSNNNGVVAKVKRISGKTPQLAGTITCAGGGSVLSTFVQNKEFYSGRDLYLLVPKHPMNLYVKLFLCTIIEANKYRFSYGRQANKTLPNIIIKVPANLIGEPDWSYMEQYVKSLPYSDRI